MNNLVLKQVRGMYQVMVLQERLKHQEAIFDLNGNQKSKWWLKVYMIDEEYYLVEDFSKHAIFHINDPDTPISKWWDFIVSYSTSYYVAVDFKNEKRAIFHMKDPDKPRSQWWDEIHFNAQTGYYLVRDLETDKFAIFHVDDPEKPISNWWYNINAYDFLYNNSEYYLVQNDDYFIATFKITNKKEEQVTEWEDIIETYPPVEKN